jgi:hypothetical protein
VKLSAKEVVPVATAATTIPAHILFADTMMILPDTQID